MCTEFRDWHIVSASCSETYGACPRQTLNLLDSIADGGQTIMLGIYVIRMCSNTAGELGQIEGATSSVTVTGRDITG